MIEKTNPACRLLHVVLTTGLAVSLIAFVAVPWASAMSGPAPIEIDGGPLGPLQLSGGADGFAYALTGAGSDASHGLLGTDKSGGVELMNGMIELQKSAGLIQGKIEVGAKNSLVLGMAPQATSITTYSTGPLYAGYITLAPSSHFSISAGHVGSLEGYESGIDWSNANIFTTALFEVQNGQSMGVSATASYGPLSATVVFGDGFDTQVWNYLQAAATYTVNDDNALTLYGATNLGLTGAGAHLYGSATTPWHDSYVGYGPTSAAPYVNTSMIGAYYSYTFGNLSVVPEVQYAWVGRTPSLGLLDYSSNFGATIMADYQFGKSPWSLGGFVEYFSSNGPDLWFLNPGAKGFGLSITPTWRGKYLFARADFGFLHLTQISNTGVPSGYGADLKGANQASLAVEAGVLF